MPVLSFAEYRPDVSDYEGNSSRNITNVLPRGDGYGPFCQPSIFTQALPGTCRGAFLARKNDGTVAIFAGTTTKLYLLNAGTGTWTDVSRSGGTYNTLGNQANWTFAQFNNFVFATQASDKLQHYDLTSSTAFVDPADSNTPQAAYVTVVNSFLVLTGIANPNVYRIQWSGLNDVSSSSSFTAGVNSSDFQDLADGGLVLGAAGGEYGVIFQQQIIRRLLYSPGSPFVFQIDRIAIQDGLAAPYSLILGGNNIFWLSPLGFRMLPPGGVPTPIGKERVDRTFLADYDPSQPQLVIGANDPSESRIYWAYKSLGNGSLYCDKMLQYDWALDRWSLINGGGFTGVQYITQLAAPSATLEGIDAAYGQGNQFVITSYTTAGVFTANQPGTYEPGGVAPTNPITAGMGVQITTTSTVGLPSPLQVGTPYYIAASNLTTSTFSLTTSGGIGQAVSTSGTTSLVLPTTITTPLKYAVESEEALTIGTLDSITNSAILDFAGVNTSNQFGFFTANSGPNLQAIMETPEQGGDGQRLFVRGFRIVTDAVASHATTNTVTGSASFRESPQAPYNYTAESAINAQGFVPLRVSTRYSRARVTMPQATQWTYAAGVEADNVPDGKR